MEEGKKLSIKGLEGYLNYETIRKKKDGTLFPVSISATPLEIDGQAKREIGIYMDISERKLNELLQQVLYNITKAANSPISLDQLYKTVHKELGTIIDTTNFYIALVDGKEDNIYFPYHQDEKDDDFPIMKLSTTDTLTTYVIKTGKPLLNDNSQYEKMINQGILSPEGSTTPQSIWLGVPLKIKNKVIGAMVVQSYTHSDLYSKKDIKLMEFVSSQAASAIERKSTEERIKHLSFHDSLTGLYNRAYFEEELERYNFPRYYPLSIVMLDVNGLKIINDTFGHSEGDRLLQHFSQVLISVSRQGDILARIGGDEFAIILPSTTSEEAHSFCERIKKVCQQDKIKPIYLRLNASLGHTTQEGEYKDTNTLLKEADKKMYQDKLFNGKSREKHFLEAFRIVLAERDPHTSDHAQRLQELALSLGKRVGLTEYQLGNLKLLALLHDIGKIGIPDSILFKTYILTPSEWEKMREHSRIGYRMAKNIPDFAPIAQEILYHHEHWDGTGYPVGLKGERIPLLSRIISIIDAYDVMQSRRPYKGPISKTEALKEIKRCAGTQFDPQLVEIFLKIIKT
jgi:diguanylate cyclase (GGDEF)-like protein